MILMIEAIVYMSIMTVTALGHLVFFSLKAAYLILKSVLYIIAYVAWAFSKCYYVIQEQEVPIKINKENKKLGIASH
jgi:hypothetical protein